MSLPVGMRCPRNTSATKLFGPPSFVLRSSSRNALFQTAHGLGEDHDRRTACAHRRCRLRRARLSTSKSPNSPRGRARRPIFAHRMEARARRYKSASSRARHRLAVRYDLCNDSPFVCGARPQRLWIEQERLITTRTLTPSGTAIKSTPSCGDSPLCGVAHDQPSFKAIGGVFVRPLGNSLH
jgi:hypothetical protein